RAPIKKIKIDKTLMSFPNDVNDDEVTCMINNFEEDVWEPILINSDYYLLDGQHRLRLAFRTGIKFIDVIMEKKKDPLVSKKLKDAIKRKEKLERLMGAAIL
ncbi:MAG: ParB N-terminal domain-containing protein, partial [Deltaproteobacteria bacterium]